MKYLIILLTVLLLVFTIYSAFISVPLNQCTVVFFRYPGRLVVYQKPGLHFNLLNSIPANGITRNFSLNEREYSFPLEKKAYLLDKEIPILKSDILIVYRLKMEKIESLFKDFRSSREIDEFLKKEISSLAAEKIGLAMENNYNLNAYLKTLPAEITGLVRDKYEGITVNRINILSSVIIPDFNYRKLSEKVNQSIEYEENFKMDLRAVELEKVKLQKEAENEVAYLRIIGDYIKENPVILKYLLIKKLDKNSVIMLPTSEIGFDFSSTVREKALQRIRESTNARSY
ncbi:MAG: hypothetical protein PHF84_03855 [bacterium]|nr:hypothetical protein [bacterium]